MLAMKLQKFSADNRTALLPTSMTAEERLVWNLFEKTFKSKHGWFPEPCGYGTSGDVQGAFRVDYNLLWKEAER